MKEINKIRTDSEAPQFTPNRTSANDYVLIRKINEIIEAVNELIKFQANQDTDD